LGGMIHAITYADQIALRGRLMTSDADADTKLLTEHSARLAKHKLSPMNNVK
jgi:hypothetical protein